MSDVQGVLSAAEGRDASGRFVKGNPGGPGNPYARRMGHVRKTILGALTDDVLSGVVGKLITRALDGDLGAIRIVLAYGFGKPGMCLGMEMCVAEEAEALVEQARAGQAEPAVEGPREDDVGEEDEAAVNQGERVETAGGQSEAGTEPAGGEAVAEGAGVSPAARHLMRKAARRAAKRAARQARLAGRQAG